MSQIPGFRFSSIRYHRRHGPRHIILPPPHPQPFLKPPFILLAASSPGRRGPIRSPPPTPKCIPLPLFLSQTSILRKRILIPRLSTTLPIRTTTSRPTHIPFPRPEAGKLHLLHAGLDAPLVDPLVQPGFHQLRDLGDVLQSGAGAHERADREVEAVVREEGEGEGGGGGWGGGRVRGGVGGGGCSGRRRRVCGGRRHEGDGERARETYHAYGKSDG